MTSHYSLVWILAATNQNSSIEVAAKLFAASMGLVCSCPPIRVVM